MRLRDLTPTETAAVEARRDAVRETLARIDAPWKPTAEQVASAPFLDDFEERWGGLHGLCWGHPVQGDVFITTTPIVQSGDGWVLTQNTLYILGGARPGEEENLDRILSGRRGRGRPVIASGPELEDEATPGPRVG